MPPVGDTISSNETGLSFAEEASLKVLPGSPVWFELEPNSYADFGGSLSKVNRDTLNATRQLKKGTITDLEAAGGYNEDFTQNNFVRLMQGFFFADAHEKFGTKTLNVAQLPITDIDALGVYTAGAGGLSFLVGDLVLAKGNTAAANNAFGLVTAQTATTVDTDIATSANASPAADSEIFVVGFEFDAADATLTLGVGEFTLGSTVKDMTQFGLVVGEWCYIGGDAGASQFASGTGYARVKSIGANAIVFDKATWTVATNSGVGKSIRIFFDIFNNNAINPDDIICRSYQFERTLGKDANGTQSEYLTGCIANEFALNLPVSDKLTADVTLVGLDHETRNGLTGVKTGARVPGLSEDAFNTSSDVFRVRMSILDATTLDPTDLFAFLSDFKLNINNNVTALKAVGIIGGFSINIGNFIVTGTATAYFSTVAAIESVRANDDVTIDLIMAKKNAGMIYDIPLLGVNVDNLAIEKDTPITVPLESDAAENPLGYTLGLNYFRFLPNVAMPVAQ
jgi:hypothetical protein